jgi:hypothetical protein
MKRERPRRDRLRRQHMTASAIEIESEVLIGQGVIVSVSAERLHNANDIKAPLLLYSERKGNSPSTMIE